MLLGRYISMIAMLAIAGSLAVKRVVPVTTGTLRTHTPLFAGILVMMIVVVGALTFFRRWLLVRLRSIWPWFDEWRVIRDKR